jgi:hypothetical protein
MNLSQIIATIYKGGANKAVVVAAGALLNAAESGHWTSVQSTVGYVMTILVWLIPNLTSQSANVTVNPSQEKQQ